MDKRLDKEEFTEIWRLAEEVGEIGYWEWDLQTNETYWSEQKKKIYGLERMEEGSFETFLSVIDEETRQLVEQEIAQVLAGEKEFYDLQHRIFLRNGREVWV
ncbi:PAS domain-containing protein, partial [Nitratifractor sp.]